MTICIWRFPSAIHSGKTGGSKHPSYLLFVMVVAMIILFHGQFILKVMRPILSAWALSCFYVPNHEYYKNVGMPLSYNCLEEWPRWQGSGWRNQTHSHITLLFFDQKLTQLTKNFEHLQRQAGPPFIADGNPQIQMIIRAFHFLPNPTFPRFSEPIQCHGM